MDAIRWQIIERLFAGAVALEGAGRSDYLARECAGDGRLRADVEALLHQDAAAADDIEGCVSRAVQDLLESEAGALVGRRMGAWRLCAHIARGGMGAVYLAERADGQFEQRAALKVLNPALLSPDALGRFNAERRILARLNHPNIARLIDGGATSDGMPYLVMEYIEGVAIDRYCAEHSLNTRARLGLMQKLCAAVDFAHKNLVIHRDIKPSNVLVDARGEPKLLDFGVAKLVAGESPLAVSPITVADLRVLTPRYASPEQILGEPITTATDVYSLGALLYELLAGRFPFQDAERSPTELSRAICESEPERPSSAVRRATPGAARHLSRTLAGDLDNIVLMALRKEPARRYGSALQLAEDIERYLSDEPVRARSSRFGYRARKFLVRHRVGALGSLAAALLLVAIVVFYGLELAAQRDQARAEAAKASAVSRFLTNLFHEASPESGLGRNVTAEALLERGATRVSSDLRRAPRIQAALMGAIGQSFMNMADYAAALKQIDAALAIERRLGPGEADTLHSLELERGQLLGQLGRFAPARAQLEAVRGYDARRYGTHSRQVASVLRALARVDDLAGRFAAARAKLQAAIADLRALGVPARADLARTLDAYGDVQINLGEFDGAQASLTEALGLARSLHGGAGPQMVSILDDIGATYMIEGDESAALSYINRALTLARGIFGSDNLITVNILEDRANAEWRAGQFVASERDGRAALLIARRALGDDQPTVVLYRDVLAASLALEGRYAAALAITRKDLASERRIYGLSNVRLANTMGLMSYALNGLGRFREALVMADRSVRLAAKSMGAQSAYALEFRVVRALPEAGLGHADVAERQLRQAITGLRRIDEGRPDDWVAFSEDFLGRILLRERQPAGAVKALSDSVHEWARVTGPGSSSGAAEAQADLGRALLAEGRVEAGVAQLSAARAELARRLGPDNPLARKAAADLLAAQARLRATRPADSGAYASAPR